MGGMIDFESILNFSEKDYDLYLIMRIIHATQELGRCS